MSFLKPKVYMPPPPSAPEPIAEPDFKRAAALSDEAIAKERKQRKGRGSTVVAGVMGGQTGATGGTGGSGSPTLLG